MRTQQNEPLTGIFNNIRLDCVPEFPPLPLNERSNIGANYPTELAYLLIYLNDKNATEIIPSTYIIWLLDHLLKSLKILVSGQQVIVDSFSDPWQYQLKGVPAQDLVYITIQIPHKIVIVKDAGVPLGKFGIEIIRVAQQWKQYLSKNYSEEISDPVKGKQYQVFLEHLTKAKYVLQGYSG